MSNGDLLMRVDSDGRVVEWLPAAQEAFGLSAREAVGRFLREILRAVGDREGSRARAPTADSMTAKPVLSGSAVIWEVRGVAADPVTSARARDLAMVSDLFTHAPMVLHVLDSRLHVMQLQDSPGGAQRTATCPLPGRPFPEAVGLRDPGAEEAVARRVLETGEPELNRVVRSERGRRKGRRRFYSVSYVRMEGERGEVLGLVASALDVTDRERALQRVQVIADVRRRVSERLEIMSACRELVEAIVPAFAGLMVVEVVEDVIRGEEPPLAPMGQDVPLRRTAFKGPVAAYPVGDVRPLPDGTPFSRVLADLRPRLVAVQEDSVWLSADPCRGEAIRHAGGRSLIVAPLALRGQALGVASFYRLAGQEPFDEDDVSLTSDVCAHAAVCIDNARRYTRERTIASTVKRRLLPQKPAAPSTVECAPLHIPGSGGGAWFDVIELSGARTALVLGDVGGSDLSTATAMGQLRIVIHSLAGLDLEPDELMSQLHESAKRLAAERAALLAADPLNREPLVAGCLIAVYDAVDQTCTFVRCGVPDPYAFLPDGRSSLLSIPSGPELAGPESALFAATSVPLPAGSILVIGNEDLLTSSERLCSLVREGADKTLEEVSDSLAYALGRDDEEERLLLLVRTKPLPAEQVLTMPLPPSPCAASLARQATLGQLEKWNVGEEAAFTAELIVSELVGNAVLYGAPPLRLRLIMDRDLTYEVSDGADSAPHLKHARPVDETGRGLFIIANVADNWGTRYHDEGKTVWAEQSADALRE
ncbi:SpoIIE family protein phosphatase [Streptomyces sp. NPDC046985]|uniref:ATP-binding SpoIIE family protein phosphatase n=1 Tax=Streptomyces sp. NPDC046985 TaxID=3155377 RepID=UPI003406365F